MRDDDEAVRCRRVCVEYGSARALSDIDLSVTPGEVVALLGASGSGKSTLLGAIAGLVSICAGEIWLDGRPVADREHSLPAERRAVGVVFQNFALWPHLSVIDTVAYPLRRAGQTRRSSAAQASDLLTRLGIDHLATRRPAELSGGEQQRVGLARALARNARLYLLDEPTAHLDTHLRSAFLDAVRERQRASGAAVVYATHDAGEALALADRVGLIVDGRLVQVASPQICYAQPVSEAAARLTGACFLLDSVPVGPGQSGLGSLMVRPEWIDEGGPLTGTVDVVAFRGPSTDYHLTTLAGAIVLSQPGPPRHRVGDRVQWSVRQAWPIGPADADLPESDQPSATIAPA